MIITEKKLDEVDIEIATKIGQAIINIRKEQRPSERVRKPFYKIRHLYLIQSVIGGPVKIGISEDLNLRIKQIQGGSPFELVIVRTMSFDSMNLSGSDAERCLHRELRNYKIRGEWFDPRVIDILDFMARQFQFDFYERFGKIILNDFNR